MRLKALFALTIGVLSLGAMNVLEPQRSLDNRADAPLLAPVYAPPVEAVETMELRSGQTLSELLMRASITGPDLLALLRALETQKSASQLVAGAEVTIRRWVADGEARSVELRMNADTTVQVQRQAQGWASSIMVTPVVIDTVFVGGTITAGRSLYESSAMDSALSIPIEERIQLVSALADIFEYKIDFLHEIQPGDRYALAYEREARPDGTARSRRVLVSRIENKGTRYDAVLFKTGSYSSYYDLDGRSLKRGFRRYPLDYVRITSSFAWKRYHPILGIYRAHLGTDFGASAGTAVRATGDGTVIAAGRSGGYGNVVTIRHASGYTTRYAHLRGFANDIRAGKRVTMNQVVGYVGSTGLATAPHLHYELRQNDRAVDFSKVKLPSAPPLASVYRDPYRTLVRDRLVLLEEAVIGARFARRPAAINSAAVGGGL